MTRAALVAVALGAGCFSPTYPANVLCGPGGECPPGDECGGDGVCHPIAGSPDAGACGMPEICNGVDDDCDVEIDEDFFAGGVACDADGDGCFEDALVCTPDGTGTLCEDRPPGAELCDGLDNDCNGTADDLWPELGTPCDGDDSDLCADDVMVCNAVQDGTVCGPGTDEVELCDGLDNDCDASIDEDWAELGTACDGVDADLCAEGVFVCASETTTDCSDVTDDLVETCDGTDEDCDGSIDNVDLSDPAHCGDCATVCVNAYGGVACTGGVCTPTCDAGAMDCDGDPVNGCELLDTNPVCADAADLGSISGDTTTGSMSTSGSGEATFRVRVTENALTLIEPITARIELDSPPSIDFDLYVTCLSCAGASAESHLGPGATDVVDVGRNDMFGEQSYDLFIEVRYVSATGCDAWTLSISGFVLTNNRLCD